MAAQKQDRSVKYNGPGNSFPAAFNAYSDSHIIPGKINCHANLPRQHDPLVHFAAYCAEFKAQPTYFNTAPVSNFATDIYFSHMELEFTRQTGVFHQRFTS